MTDPIKATDTRILDPRVELLVGAIHCHIEQYPGWRLDHDGMYELAIATLEALEGDDCLREPFIGSLMQPPPGRPRVGDLVVRDLAGGRVERGMVTGVTHDVHSSTAHVQFQDGHTGGFPVSDDLPVGLRPLLARDMEQSTGSGR